jgi:hypothetical protein
MGLLVASCGGTDAALTSTPHPLARIDGIEVTAPSPDVTMVQEDDRAPILAAHAAATDVVTSAQFVYELCKQDKLAVRVGGTTMPGCDVARRYFGLDKDVPRLPLRYIDGGISFLETAHTVTRMPRRVPGGTTIPAFAVVTLRDVTLSRADSDVEHMACAVNTLAHEWTHLVSRTGAESYFQDGAHKDATERLVSYTVGALAQCVFLAQHGYPDMNIAGCVDQIGTHVFDKHTCTRAGAEALRERAAGHRP